MSQLVGQPPGRPGTAASGLLGCLNAKDWAVRKAAADALVAVALILGRDMEPEGCWLRDDPRSVTGRCIRALEEDRFDKVRVGGYETS